MAQILLLNPSTPPKARAASGGKRTTMKRNKKGQFLKATKTSAKRKSAPRRKKNAASPRTYHKNPSALGGFAGLMGPAVDGMAGAAGALLIRALFVRLPVPDAVKSGTGGAVARTLSAIALAHFGRKLLGPRFSKGLITGVVAVEVSTLAAKMAAEKGLNLGYFDAGTAILTPDLGQFEEGYFTGDDGKKYFQASDGGIFLAENAGQMGEIIPFQSQRFGVLS